MKFIIRSSGPGIQRGRYVVIIPDGGAAKIARREPAGRPTARSLARSFSSERGINILPNLSFYVCTIAEDNAGDIDYGRGRDNTFLAIVRRLFLGNPSSSLDPRSASRLSQLDDAGRWRTRSSRNRAIVFGNCSSNRFGTSCRLQGMRGRRVYAFRDYLPFKENRLAGGEEERVGQPSPEVQSLTCAFEMRER